MKLVHAAAPLVAAGFSLLVFAFVDAGGPGRTSVGAGDARLGWIAFRLFAVGCALALAAAFRREGRARLLLFVAAATTVGWEVRVAFSEWQLCFMCEGHQNDAIDNATYATALVGLAAGLAGALLVPAVRAIRRARAGSGG